MDVSDSEEKLF